MKIHRLTFRVCATMLSCTFMVLVMLMVNTPPVPTTTAVTPVEHLLPATVLRVRLQEGSTALHKADKSIRDRLSRQGIPGILLEAQDAKRFGAFQKGLVALCKNAAAPTDAELQDLVDDLEVLEKSWGNLRPALDRAVRQAEAAEVHYTSVGDPQDAETKPSPQKPR